ncbi:fumarylacetoacetate hydrolase family protein [Thalassotalea euphylliae]|uniref:Fumarylacetoacetate hydrolase family protein n=1 Tax=Thalassotalea euphylliae TaxID=1655234 RepID=A0A3E0UG90_9GAMM|nr:fumarylacetoacetate hydrolase family protein [Thalassotalea euphylliae]REL36061.1 fumarylacetoacetate hydrolase family protein [Thalassotalea euphylliae]
MINNYQHKDVNGAAIDLPIGKVVCVGQNYLDHIQEMNSIANEEAVLFLKPNTALCALAEPLVIPKERGECHNEVEVTILIKETLSNASVEEIDAAIWGCGIGLDLTLRDVQKELKRLGRPWERSKSFDLSAPMSPFIPLEEIKALGHDLANITFDLSVNNELRQQGNTELMMRSIRDLLVIISREFTLLPGDVVMTGTPKGVAPLVSGDQLELTLFSHQFSAQVA